MKNQQYHITVPVIPKAIEPEVQKLIDDGVDVYQYFKDILPKWLNARTNDILSSSYHLTNDQLSLFIKYFESVILALMTKKFEVEDTTRYVVELARYKHNKMMLLCRGENGIDSEIVEMEPQEVINYPYLQLTREEILEANPQLLQFAVKVLAYR